MRVSFPISKIARYRQLSLSLLGLLAILLAPNTYAVSQGPAEDTTDVDRQDQSAFRLKQGPPPGFEDLTSSQTTQADLYFAGEFLTSVFVEFDPYTVAVQGLEEALTLIPNLRDPAYIAQVLSGPQPTGSEYLCTSARRVECGIRHPAVAEILFDESRYRIDLFVHPDQLLVHAIQTEKYLPQSTATLANLHNIRMTASGVGSQRYFNVTSESYLSHQQQRVRVRYGLSDEGPTLHEFAWQRDRPNMEYEIGSIRTISGNLAFGGDVDLLGFRVASSTKTRVDLDQALASPIFLFLSTRSRVDVFRNTELLDSRFYAAGNQQLDTSNLPDGAYTVTIRIEDLDGSRRTEEHFFVRSAHMPPKGEPQYYVEAGRILETHSGNLPQLAEGAWLRAGASIRARDHLTWDSELHYANGQTVLASGVMLLRPTWHLYGGGLLGSQGELGLALRGGWFRDDLRVNFDLRHVHEGGAEVVTNAYSLTRGGYTQGSATVAFPLGSGQLYLRGRVNHRASSREHGFGFSYLGSMYRKNGVTADLVLDGGAGTDANWIRAGVNVRWYNGLGSSTVSPGLRYTSTDGVQPEMYGLWQAPNELPGLGRVDQSILVEHGAQRSAIGARLIPLDMQQSEFEFGYQRQRGSRRGNGAYYALNNQFSVVNTAQGTTIGDGGNNAGAVIVNVHGNVEGRFAVMIGNRVVGQVRSGRPNIISLRPYETYQVRIKPLGDAIVGYDEAPVPVTLYPGNVQTITFSARTITVLIAQALRPDGSPLGAARITNVEGYGATDPSGWFQVEVAHNEPLLVQKPSGNMCLLDPGDYVVEDGLAVLPALVCEPIQAPLSAAVDPDNGPQQPQPDLAH